MMVGEHFQTTLLLIVIALVRVYAFVRLFAPFEPIAQSILIQSALSFGLTMPFMPDLILNIDRPTIGMVEFLVRGANEALIGSTYAILCSIPIKIGAAVSEVIDNTRGISANGPQNPVTREDAAPLSSISTVVFSLVLFHYYFHLDVLWDFYQLDSPDMAHAARALADLARGASDQWVAALDVLRILLTKVLALLGLLIAIDITAAIATKHLKSGDLGGAENTIKIVIVAVWALLLAQHILAPQSIESLRRSFHDYVVPG